MCIRFSSRKEGKNQGRKQGKNETNKNKDKKGRKPSRKKTQIDMIDDERREIHKTNGHATNYEKGNDKGTNQETKDRVILEWAKCGAVPRNCSDVACMYVCICISDTYHLKSSINIFHTYGIDTCFFAVYL